MTAGEAWQASKGRMPALFGVVGLMALVMLAPVAVIAAVVAVLVSTGLTGSSDSVGGLVAPVLAVMILLYRLCAVLQDAFRVRARGRGAGGQRADRRPAPLVAPGDG